MNLYALDWKKMGGLLPVIMQNAYTNEALMLAYANRSALRATVEKGLATFYSRSRSGLWTKGETSGNTMAIEAIL